MCGCPWGQSPPAGPGQITRRLGSLSLPRGSGRLPPGVLRDFGIKFLNLECEFLRHEICSECGFLSPTQKQLWEGPPMPRSGLALGLGAETFYSEHPGHSLCRLTASFPTPHKHKEGSCSPKEALHTLPTVSPTHSSHLPCHSRGHPQATGSPNSVSNGARCVDSRQLQGGRCGQRAPVHSGQ